MTWRNPDDYAYTRELSRELWAWEFLRRNPEYRKDWQEFWTTWQALEADYGRPPNRDFQRWKRDSRAYVSEEQCKTIDEDALGVGCAGEEGKILIECWLGAKWGFYKFPLSPDHDEPNVPDELLWREVFTEVPRVTRKDKEYLSGSNGRIALGFDLTSPLPAQLEEAKHLLVGEQRRLAQSGALPPRSVKASREDWTLRLRLLDAEAAQAPKEVIVETLFTGEENEDRLVKLGKEAHRLRDGGYIRILLMPQG